ncbi:MAG: NigD-like protein [Alistipes sp.]|nr:NigD-like protein [Alistipes senegalensis]MCM1250889.1 NigD-like protein [Alistipes sp.]
MKNFGFFLGALAFAFGAVSCNDTDVDQAGKASFVTVHQTIAVGGYYFETDGGKTIFPGDTSRIGAYKATEGQRAIITYNLLENAVPGYDYNAAIYAIGHLFYSSARVVSDEAQLEKMADDPAQYLDGRWLGNWVTATVRYAAFDLSKHKFYLIVNDVAASEGSEEGYLDVELRHDDGDDPQGGTVYNSLVSFNVDPIADRLDGAKGLRVRYYDGSIVRYVKVDRAENEEL